MVYFLISSYHNSECFTLQVLFLIEFLDDVMEFASVFQTVAFAHPTGASSLLNTDIFSETVTVLTHCQATIKARLHTHVKSSWVVFRSTDITGSAHTFGCFLFQTCYLAVWKSTG